MNNFYKINNWNELQKGQKANERTPFIKVHTNLLISKPWFDLDDTTRLIFIELQILGSECMGYLPEDETIAFRIRRPLEQVKEALVKLNEHYISIVDEEAYKKHLEHFKKELEDQSQKRKESGRLGGIKKHENAKLTSQADVTKALDSFQAEKDEVIDF
ncbi:hypothetical protein OAS34_00565 [Methylophilaceae bacterium]|nr:hypothetical protein [Methylophilaceae bacterium]